MTTQVTASSSPSETDVPTDPEALREKVRDRYAAAARRATGGAQASCCGPEEVDAAALTSDPITSDLYAADETAGLPAEAVLASLGCGNPTALAELHLGETVLDLGSG